MAKTLTIQSDITAVDTRTGMTKQGSVAAPSLVTPSGSTLIKTLVLTAAAEGLANGSAVFFLRIGGNAVKRGEQTIMIGAGGTIGVQAGSDAAPQIVSSLILENVDIEIQASDTLTLYGEMAGSDLGTARVVATLIFA